MAGLALVTGAAGFAGGHLAEELRSHGHEVAGPSHAELDLLDAERTRAAVAELRPERVFHLAALASVGRSWEDPLRSVVENQAMTLNLLEAVRESAPHAKVVIASSGEVYGPPAELPVGEEAPLAPQSPYAVSKASSDLLGGLYAEAWGLHVVRTRAFNHAGPGQSDTYVIGSLTRQVAAAEAAGGDQVVVRTGNADAARDFTDVRDVAAAYRLAAELEPGVYNVASGRAVKVRELVQLVAAATELEVRHEVDPARVRAHEVLEIRGSAARLRDAAGWGPEIPLEQTIADALARWRRELA